MNEATETTKFVLTGILPAILIIASMLAFPISLVLLKIYRRSVIKSMESRANPDQKISNNNEEIRTPSIKASPHLDINFIDANSAQVGKEPTSEALYSKAEKALRSNYKIYLLAGSCYSLVMTFASLLSSNTPITQIRILGLFIVYLWPSVLILSLLLVVDRKSKIFTVLTYFLIFGLIIISAGMITYADLSNMVFGWLSFNLLPTVLIFAFLYRAIRAVGPLVLSFMILAVTGSGIAVSIIGYYENLLESVEEIGLSLGLESIEVLISIILIGFVALGLVGWQVLRLLGKLYINKKMSDQAITADSLMFLFGIFQPIYLAFDGAIWILSGLVGFLLYKLATIIFFRFKKKRNETNIPNLLLLRVFSLGKRSESLFDKLQMYWRNVGTISMIAGPDLATSTVEPHEFFEFLGRKLSRSFIDSSKTFRERLEAVDLGPDPDGRYRVNEFFCFDDTWKMVLDGLVHNSNAVLMDLRGFTQNNDGCKHEIKELISLKLVDKILLITDKTTDNNFLGQLIKEYWNHMRGDSPNLEATVGKLQIFKYTGSNDDEIKQIVRVLSDCSVSS